jgi:hypothetical protein
MSLTFYSLQAKYFTSLVLNLHKPIRNSAAFNIQYIINTFFVIDRGGCTSAQSVSRRNHGAEARIKSQGIPCKIFRG